MKTIARIKRPVEWRAIPGYEGRYSITRDGRVWSHRPSRQKWLRWASARAYAVVRLYDLSGKQHTYLVHRLVMAVWGPPQPSPKHEINHKDFNGWNNHVTNLEWTTHRENTQHAIAGGHFSTAIAPVGSANPNAKLTEAQILEIRARYTGKRGEQTTLGREFGVSQKYIWEVVHRRKWKHI